MVQRRHFLIFVGACLAPAPARAQPKRRIPRIGILFDDAVSSEPFRQGLRELGYVEGENIVLDEPAREGAWPDMVARLIERRVDVIVTRSTPATIAAKRATATIPIVMAGAGDPLATGMVSSLARPAGNVTGVSFTGAELAGKRLELLKEAVPGLATVALPFNPANPAQASYFAEAEAGARLLGVKLQAFEVRASQDLDRAFATMAQARPSALLITGDPVIQRHIARILAFAARNRLPAMYNARENVEAGGLMSYGAARTEIARRAAGYVDRILKGAQPADLPIEQPTRFELVINRKTANALGLKMPQSLLARADRVLD